MCPIWYDSKILKKTNNKDKSLYYAILYYNKKIAFCYVTPQGTCLSTTHLHFIKNYYK